MHLTVVIPGLFWPDSGDIDYLYPKIEAKNFKSLVKHANVNTLNYGYSNLFYTASTGLGKGSLAKQLAAKLQITNEYPDFLLAEPTHLRLDRDRLLIAEPALLQLDEDEEIIIINAINSHFNGEIKLYYVSDNLWLIGHKLDVADCAFYPILDIIGENIDDYLVKDSIDATKLNKLINEIQMLLFNLPLNEERKQEGSLVANSLWLSDTTVLPQICERFEHIIANNLKNITNHAKIRPFPTPIDAAFQKNNFVIIDNLYHPCCYRDSFSWMDKLHQLDQTLGLLLKQLLDSRKIQELDILVPLHAQTICLNIRHNSRYKFWQNKQLINLVKDTHAL